jgi:hypothetical protein
MRFELMTSSLPRRRSTPELRGRRVERDGNHRPSAQLNKFHLFYTKLERATRFELATLSLEG